MDDKVRFLINQYKSSGDPQVAIALAGYLARLDGYTIKVWLYTMYTPGDNTYFMPSVFFSKEKAYEAAAQDCITYYSGYNGNFETRLEKLCKKGKYKRVIELFNERSISRVIIEESEVF